MKNKIQNYKNYTESIFESIKHVDEDGAKLYVNDNNLNTNFEKEYIKLTELKNQAQK